jgi:molybdopterin-binding protein
LGIPALAAIVHAVPIFHVSEAAQLLGVSDDTVRRWADAGRLRTMQHENGRLGIDGVELARFAAERSASAPAGEPTPPVVGESARNRFTGIVTRVVRDTVMAQVELQAGPFHLTSLMSREAADDLGLEPGVLAVAAVKSTNVVIELLRQP